MSNPFKIVRFLKDHTWIIGVDMEKYGPFEKGQVVSLPLANAEQLIKMGVAVETRKEEEKPSIKEVFRGEVLTGYVEAAKGQTLNEFAEKTPAEIEAKRQELLRMVREEREKVKQLRKRAEDLWS